MDIAAEFLSAIINAFEANKRLLTAVENGGVGKVRGG